MNTVEVKSKKVKAAKALDLVYLDQTVQVAPYMGKKKTFHRRRRTQTTQLKPLQAEGK